MKSNNFGSWKSRIIVSVKKDDAPDVAAKLGIPPFTEAEEPGRVYFAWTRSAARRGNDEDIVFELSALLGNPWDQYDWHIDWDGSEF